jgi:hypothetical protein
LSLPLKNDGSQPVSMGWDRCSDRHKKLTFQTKIDQVRSAAGDKDGRRNYRVRERSPFTCSLRDLGIYRRFRVGKRKYFGSLDFAFLETFGYCQLKPN